MASNQEIFSLSLEIGINNSFDDISWGDTQLSRTFPFHSLVHLNFVNNNSRLNEDLWNTSLTTCTKLKVLRYKIPVSNYQRNIPTLNLGNMEIVDLPLSKCKIEELTFYNSNYFLTDSIFKFLCLDQAKKIDLRCNVPRSVLQQILITTQYTLEELHVDRIDSHDFNGTLSRLQKGELDICIEMKQLHNLYIKNKSRLSGPRMFSYNIKAPKGRNIVFQCDGLVERKLLVMSKKFGYPWIYS